MTVLAHLSDPHFGTEVDAVREALRDELQASPPDVVVVTGDITQRARRGQFQRARAFLDSLPRVPCLVLPGNHDIPLFDVLTRFTRPYRLYERYVARELEPGYEDGALSVVCVNATRPTRHKHGVLSTRQIESTARRLDAARGAFRVVAIHQPLAVTLPRDERNRVRGAGAALESWIGAGADLFLGGHIHLPYCIPVASRAGRSAVLLQAGTAVSRRVRHAAPQSYNRVVLERAEALCMRVERRDFDPGAKAFRTASRHEARGVSGAWSVHAVA